MIPSAASDYREAARRRLPRFLFDYLDGGANSELTLQANSADLAAMTFRQRVLQNITSISLATELFGQKLTLPVLLSPIGIAGMYARRGEAQLARAANAKGIPFVQSTLSICSLEEIVAAAKTPPWFQLYVLKDRGFMKHVLDRAQAAGISTLVFTVDMPVPGKRYRDAHSGMSGPYAAQRRLLQALGKPRWAWDVGVWGRPHTLGNISLYLGKEMGLADYMGWLTKNFDPAIGWRDLSWIRELWRGSLVIKGILDVDDARAALEFGADGIVVSNHGGRQLDSVSSTARALPAIVDAIAGRSTILVDSGIRCGVDVVKMLALGAQGVMIGRAAMYALATDGQQGVEHLLELFEQEIRVTMTLLGIRTVNDINRSVLT